MKNIAAVEPLDSKKIGDALIAHAKLNASDIERILQLQKDRKYCLAKRLKVWV